MGWGVGGQLLLQFNPEPLFSCLKLSRNRVAKGKHLPFPDNVGPCFSFISRSFTDLECGGQGQAT